MPISELVDTGKQDDRMRTFVFEDEGHTLGNALRRIIAMYPDVHLCAYTIPHPAEAKMNFRIQMRKGRAIDALRRGLEDLVKLCDHTIETFDQAVSDYKMDMDQDTS